jgi:hypothetical protein
MMANSIGRGRQPDPFTFGPLGTGRAESSTPHPNMSVSFWVKFPFQTLSSAEIGSPVLPGVNL